MNPQSSSSQSAPASVEAQTARWFAEEVHQHDAALKSYLRGLFPAERDLDDVVQESYLRVWKVRAVAPILSVKAFLFRVARNIALDRIRRNRNAALSGIGNLEELCVIDDRSGVAEIINTNEMGNLLAEALAALPPRAHELIVLCKLHGMSHHEAAERLGISTRTVDEHILRGTKRLGLELRKRGLDGAYER